MNDDQALGFPAPVSDAPLFMPRERSQIAIVADGLVGDIGLCLDHASNEVEIGSRSRAGRKGRAMGAALSGLPCNWFGATAPRSAFAPLLTHGMPPL